MKATTVAEALGYLKKQFPNAGLVEIEYYGAGDSFDSFNNVNIINKDGTSVDYQTFSEEEIIESLIDVLWIGIEKSDADFNNEGSEGKVIFNLVFNTAEVHNSHREVVVTEAEIFDFSPKTLSPEEIENIDRSIDNLNA